MRRTLTFTAIALLMTGCATASKPGAMAAEITDATIISADSKLRGSVSMADVEGGKSTNPLWSSQVSNEDFKEALRQSLASHAMLADGEGRYTLTAELMKLKQPFAGLDMSVTSTVKYTLMDTETGEVVFVDEVAEKYTAKMGDALVGVKRLQLANEGSIKSNIGTMLKRMIETIDSESVNIADINIQVFG